MTSRDLLPVLRAVRDAVANYYGLLPPRPHAGFGDTDLLAMAERALAAEGETARLRQGEQEARSTTEVAPPSVAHPSPSPALILEYGRAVVENCGFVVGQPIDTVVDDKTLLRIWELVEFKASAKGGDTNSGPSRSERSPDMTSAVSGGYQLGEQPSGAAGGNLTTTRTYPAKLPEPPKTLEDETIEMLRQDQARRAEAPSFRGRTYPIPGCPCTMCSSLRIVRRVAFAQAVAYCEQAAKDFDETYADKHADAARYIARGLRVRAEKGAK